MTDQLCNEVSLWLTTPNPIAWRFAFNGQLIIQLLIEIVKMSDLAEYKA